MQPLNRQPAKIRQVIRPETLRETPQSRWSAVIAVGILVASGMLAYADSFSAPFVFDTLSITQNPAIYTLWPLTSNIWRPVGWWSFAINYAIGGTNVWGYHATNLAIHLAAALTLFGIVLRSLSHGRLVARFGPAGWGLALVVALLWLVHPLQTQSVTYIFQRFESLMGLFFLLTLYSFIRAQDSSRSTAWYVSAVACCLLAVMTKEVAVAAPLLVLWYDRTFVAASWREIFHRRWALYAGLGGTLVVLAAIIRSQADKLPTAGLLVVKGVTPLQYAVSQPGVIAHYLRLSLWPAGLCLDYAWPVADTAAKIVPPLVLIAALLALTVWSIFRWPAWSFLGAWFFLILAPTSSIVPIVDLAFEHRMYLPLAAVLTGVVIGGYLFSGWLLARRWPVAGRRPFVLALIGYGLMGAISMTMGCLTVRRNLDYRSAITIWSDSVRKSPKNARAYVNLGVALAEQGQVDEAAVHYRKALEIRPDYADAYYNLGVNLDKRGQVDEAIAHYRKALELRPDFATAQNNLAWVLATCSDASLRNGAKAVELAEQAVQLSNSQDPEFLDTLAAAYAEAGLFSMAMQTARRALDLAVQQNKQVLTESIKAKIPLYDARKPFREPPDRDGKGQDLHPHR